MPLHILLVDDEQPARYAMAKALANPDYEIDEASDGREAVEAIRTGGYDLVFLDLSMPIMDGQSVLREIAAERLDAIIEIIVVTADHEVPTAVECIRLGASDFISKPYEIEQLRAIASRVAQRVALQRRVQHLQDELENRQAFGALVGVSRSMRDLFARIERVANTKLDVLIQGETGTGKELIAREIHNLSDRSNGPFLAINAAAIAESLTESELFGHVKGAFTGAESDRSGCFEQADGGTLFLDEIGDMPLAVQTKMLRTLQERVVQPVGRSKSIPVDVRIVSATHQDLEQAVNDGHFRQDLFFRVHALQIMATPLRHRREDVAVLANYFLQREVASQGDRSLDFSPSAMEAMLAHAWPGNVRELEHAVMAAVAMCDGEWIEPLDMQMARKDPSLEHDDFEPLYELPLTESKNQLIEQFERRAIQRALVRHDGNVSAAARQLGIHRQRL